MHKAYELVYDLGIGLLWNSDAVEAYIRDHRDENGQKAANSYGFLQHQILEISRRKLAEVLSAKLTDADIEKLRGGIEVFKMLGSSITIDFGPSVEEEWADRLMAYITSIEFNIFRGYLEKLTDVRVSNEHITIITALPVRQLSRRY